MVLEIRAFATVRTTVNWLGSAVSWAVTQLRRRRPLVSSSLARTEVLRALVPAGEDAVGTGRKVLTRVDLVRINNRVLEEAATLSPAEIRSLEAIHLATVGRLGEDLGALITYDERMAEAAKQLGHRVVTPR
jgi:uncharacterized protein